jgi:hypothetical protein
MTLARRRALVLRRRQPQAKSGHMGNVVGEMAVPDRPLLPSPTPVPPGGKGVGA